MHIWTESPITEIWNQLRYLAYPANASSLLSGRIASKRELLWSESDELRKRAQKVAACIRQADEYFTASDGVGLATRPLLQFYGTQSLAKALIVANNRDADLAQFKHHGLSTKPNSGDAKEKSDLQKYDSDPSRWCLDGEFAVTQKHGVFPRLASTVGDLVSAGPSVLRLRDLLRCLPDLAQLYSRHYDEPSHCFYLYGVPAFDEQGRYEVYFSKNVNRADVLLVFPEFSAGYEVVSEHEHPGFKTVARQQALPAFGVVEEGTVAGDYFVRPHVSGLHNSLTVVYAALFILGMVVRYKPAFWMSTLQADETGSVSMVEAFCTLAKRRFPGDILDALWNEGFTFGTPARLS